MAVRHDMLDRKGRFYYEVNGVAKAEMTYSQAGVNKIIIDHTAVDEELRGQGVGYKLVEEAVKFARDNNIKILPLCPFANAVFKKKEEYNDVLF